MNLTSRADAAIQIKSQGRTGIIPDANHARTSNSNCSLRAGVCAISCPGINVDRPILNILKAIFPATEQAGAIAAESFLKRKNLTGFTWIRGVHTIEARAVENAAFYYGPI